MTRVMYDSVTVSEIPEDAGAVAGYVGGAWPTFKQLGRFKHANRLSIAVNASENAECLDIEAGDATPQEAAAWVKRQKARGVTRPVLYASRDNVPAVLELLEHAGIKRSGVRVWAAHYGLPVHICSPVACGASFHADATQWTDRALGRNLDESLLNDEFFAKPAKKKKPAKKAKPRKPAAPKRKVTAATLAAAIATAVQAAIHAKGVSITPATASAIAAAAAAVAGYLIPEKKKA